MLMSPFRLHNTTMNLELTQSEIVTMNLYLTAWKVNVLRIIKRFSVSQHYTELELHWQT